MSVGGAGGWGSGCEEGRRVRAGHGGAHFAHLPLAHGRQVPLRHALHHGQHRRSALREQQLSLSLPLPRAQARRRCCCC